MDVYEFNAEIKKHDNMDAAFIEFPYDTEKEFGTKGQIKVLATFDGYEYRGSLAKMGNYCHVLGLTQKTRNAIGKKPGDTVHVILKKDEEPRIIEIPEDLIKHFEVNKEARDFFDTLSYTNRKKYMQWITSAKKSETRNKRLKDTIYMLSNKVKQP
jgi:hypothetical protein